MGYFPVRYDSRVVIYERKIFIRLATGSNISNNKTFYFIRNDQKITQQVPSWTLHFLLITYKDDKVH